MRHQCRSRVEEHLHLSRHQVGQRRCRPAINDDRQIEAGVLVEGNGREMTGRVRRMVQGVQLSAPFGRYQMAIEVAEAIGPR